jgi:hypothetical protein
VRSAEQKFAAEMVVKAVQLERIEADVRASARAREVAAHHPWTPRVLAALIIGGFLYVVVSLLTGHALRAKNPMAIELLWALIGYISAKADKVVGYYFGGSAGSETKTAMLVRVAEGKR